MRHATQPILILPSWSRRVASASASRITVVFAPPKRVKSLWKTGWTCSVPSTPLGDEGLPVGCHTETTVWTVFGYRLRRPCSVPQEIPYTNSLFASFKRETVYRFSSHIRRTAFMRRWHSFSSLIPHRHSQTHSQRRYLGHTSFSMHGDRRVYSVPCFQPGIDPFIGHPSRNGKMHCL